MSAGKQFTTPTFTGWPPGLLQDDDRGLSRWLSARECMTCMCNRRSK